MTYPNINTYSNHLLQLLFAEVIHDTTRLHKWLKMFTVVNPRIAGFINSRKAAISAWDYTIAGRDASAADKAAEALFRLNDAIRIIIEQSVEQQIFGCFAVALEWEKSDDGSFHPKATRENIVKLTPHSQFGVAMPGDNAIINPDNNKYIAGSGSIIGGQLGSVGELEIIRRDMIIEWANYNRKLKGIIQAIEHGATEEEIAAGKEALQEVTKNNYLMTSDLMDFAFHQIASSNAGESFEKIIEHSNTQIAIALVGQANTAELPAKTGSRAALQVQKLITDDLMWNDMAVATAHVNRLLQFDYTINYGQGRCPWKFEFATNEGQDAETNVNVINMALDAGIPLKESEVYEKINFTPPEQSDKIFGRSGETQ